MWEISYKSFNRFRISNTSVISMAFNCRFRVVDTHRSFSNHLVIQSFWKLFGMGMEQEKCSWNKWT